MSTPSFLDAVRVVKENERIAGASYADAATKVRNPLGKFLFEQLAEFEKYHYEILSALEASLEEKGGYVNYSGKEFPQPPVFEIKAAQEPETKSVMTIITSAMELEKQAEKTYGDLAAQITEAEGHDMFYRLAEEEHKHWLILSEAFWNLTNVGVWKWARP